MRKFILGNKTQSTILFLIVFSFFINCMHCNESINSAECSSCSCSNCEKESKLIKSFVNFSFINEKTNLQIPDSTIYTIIISKVIEHPPKFA